MQFSTPARESIVFVKGMVGICQFVFALIYAVILLRYRSLVPAMCLLILTEWGLNRILRDTKKFYKYCLIPWATNDKTLNLSYLVKKRAIMCNWSSTASTASAGRGSI